MNTLPIRSVSSLNKTVGQLPGWAWQLLIAAIIYAGVSYFILSGNPDLDVRMRLSLAPLLAAPTIIQIHATAAITTFLIGLALLIAPKGFRFHRTFGWAWVITMTITAVSSFFITGIFQNSYSPIHALSAYTMIGLPFGIAAIKRHKVAEHRKMMTGMFVGAMAIAGLFSFLPGRLMWSLFFTA